MNSNNNIVKNKLTKQMNKTAGEELKSGLSCANVGGLGNPFVSAGVWS